nr:hypothetical protein [Amycolatopsis regifaucium]
MVWIPLAARPELGFGGCQDLDDRALFGQGRDETADADRVDAVGGEHGDLAAGRIPGRLVQLRKRG